MKRIKIGDLFEIKTKNGKAFLQYMYKDAKLGELVRILPGIFKEIPNNLDQVINQEELFYIYFPLNAAYKKNIVQLIDNFKIIDFRKPKFMREKYIVKEEFKGWHIINTETWERELVKKLNPDQKKLSPWGIWNDILLIERLDENWTLENWN